MHLSIIEGAIAQLVEHLHGMQGVSGSNPLGSIILFKELIGLVKILKIFDKCLFYTNSFFLIEMILMV